MILKIGGEHESMYNDTKLVTSKIPYETMMHCKKCGNQGYVSICRNITHIIEDENIVDVRCLHINNDKKQYIEYPLREDKIWNICEKCSEIEYTGRKRIKNKP